MSDLRALCGPCAVASETSKYSMQKMGLFCNKMRRMNGEFEALLSVIETFCSSPKTASNIEKYNEDRLHNATQSQSSGQKRQRLSQKKRHHQVIPIQLVTAYEGVCYSVVADSVSGLLCCSTLTTSSVITSVSLLDYIKKSPDIPGSVKASIDCHDAVEFRKAALQSQQQPQQAKQPPAKVPKNPRVAKKTPAPK